MDIQVWYTIFSHLRITDVANLSLVSKLYNSVCEIYRLIWNWTQSDWVDHAILTALVNARVPFKYEYADDKLCFRSLTSHREYVNFHISTKRYFDKHIAFYMHLESISNLSEPNYDLLYLPKGSFKLYSCRCPNINSGYDKGEWTEIMVIPPDTYIMGYVSAEDVWRFNDYYHDPCGSNRIFVCINTGTYFMIFISNFTTKHFAGRARGNYISFEHRYSKIMRYPKIQLRFDTDKEYPILVN